jgi:hypothetical protein
MQQGIGVGVAIEAAVVGDVNASKEQGASCLQLMHVVSDTYPYHAPDSKLEWIWKEMVFGLVPLVVTDPPVLGQVQAGARSSGVAPTKDHLPWLVGL